jgi:mRNA interferase MazF
MNRGDIFYADLGNITNTNIQTGIRPVLIISNNKCNRYSPTIIIAPLTSKIKRVDLPVHITLTKDEENNLELNSVVLLEQIRTINRNQLLTKIGSVCESDINNINKALKISLGLI